MARSRSAFMRSVKKLSRVASSRAVTLTAATSAASTLSSTPGHRSPGNTAWSPPSPVTSAEPTRMTTCWRR